ncbi:hypothetical protein R3Q06_12440 [Rhodococcus erythropolis]|uniref:hypothetical protein n=1 Tax=Rhodococcus erythropolis TaxID=1833 RepID=UPI00294915A1|nr:hypothetical protein [Rhodococcus erythropolis]MDV6274312.1 hypothetical protein [Rhodococcus erythropolis]
MSINEIALANQPSLPEKMEFAKALAQAGMIPRVYQGAPANVLVAIEFGEALGIKPIVAINEINVINGTPSPSASLMASLARNAGHKVRVTGDASSATCEIVRVDDPEYTHTATWTQAKAQSAGLWGKGHWGKDPATMLKWRAISECVRFACSEVLGGLKYTPDEIENFDTPAQSRTQQVSSSRSASDRFDEKTAATEDLTVVVDVDSLMAAIEKCSTIKELESCYEQSLELPPHNRSVVWARIKELKADILALEEAGQVSEPEQPTLDAEIVEEPGEVAS